MDSLKSKLHRTALFIISQITKQAELYKLIHIITLMVLFNPITFLANNVRACRWMKYWQILHIIWIKPHYSQYHIFRIRFNTYIWLIKLQSLNSFICRIHQTINIKELLLIIRITASFTSFLRQILIQFRGWNSKKTNYISVA